MMNEIKRKPIGVRVRLARISAGYTQEYVAQKLGISQQAYHVVETDDYKKMTWERIEQIAEICKIDIDELLNIDKNPIFNRDIKNCKQVGNQQAIYHEQNFERERLLYEKIITELKEELLTWKDMCQNAFRKS